MDWLLQWECLSTEAIKLNLLDIQGSQPLYDFISAVKSLDESWAAAQQALLDPVVEANGQLPSLKTMIERYRNNIRSSKAISKQQTHSAFVSQQTVVQVQHVSPRHPASQVPRRATTSKVKGK
jgi:hypothetical protein